MTTLNRQDGDLHYEDGSHRSMPASTNGSVLARYERRIQKHLAQHEHEPHIHVDGKPYDSQVDLRG